MKASLSRKQIIESFDRLDGKMTVVSFNGESGVRVMTYGGLNVFSALIEVAQRQANGDRTLVLLIDENAARRHATGLGLWDCIGDVPPELIWNPDYAERKKFRR